MERREVAEFRLPAFRLVKLKSLGGDTLGECIPEHIGGGVSHLSHGPHYPQGDFRGAGILGHNVHSWPENPSPPVNSSFCAQK